MQKNDQELCLDAQDASENPAGALPESAGKLNVDIAESACADEATAMRYQDDEDSYAGKSEINVNFKRSWKTKSGKQ